MSKKKIKPFDFSNEIMRVWKVYGDLGLGRDDGLISGAIEDTMKKVCQDACDDLKAVKRFSPNGNPSGAYSKDWTYEVKPVKRFTRKAIVYNEDHYRLTHLLENGHALVRGGRTYGHVKSYEHIYPINEKAHKQFVEEVIECILKRGVD